MKEGHRANQGVQDWRDSQVNRGNLGFQWWRLKVELSTVGTSAPMGNQNCS